MDDERRPWWRVTGVFDPDGTGSDFSYTEGLAERGVPELHMWARPTLGDDPGLDWMFSPLDTARILNRAAWQLLDGELAVGDTWEQTFDEGFVTARFSVHAPVESGEVDAFGAGDSPVLPIKWELVRPPLGPPRPMPAHDQEAAATAYDELVEGLDDDATAPSGWDLPTVPSWDEDQRFGPRTPLVLARAAQLWQADGEQFTDVLDRALVCSSYGPASYALLVSRAAARAPGRHAAVEGVMVATRELMDGLGTAWGRQARAVMEAWLLDDVEPSGRAQMWESAWWRLVEAVTAYLVVEAVADLLPVEMQTSGQGIVLTGLDPSGSAPDPRWRCSEVVAGAVAHLVATTPLDDLVDAAWEWEQVAADGPCWELGALLWTGSSYGPTLFEPALMQGWVNALATVLTHRARLDTDLVDTFLRAGRRVRALAELVNTPLVSDRITRAG